ncbi:protein of unknown function [Nannocystis exedens]|uniref:DUF4331 domain-containing protein n=1 Tax=Nannocystis exedens TaxID=54 RepID=A0A1I1UTZ7_9BACT|nr:DUF4331 family protein [Nannocystis exedens]PCC72088.1 hypothetical protein NAEX_05167 [Nannocystis exedens]SFD74139.1 protein of unknown function [Nannocystis exedens]
MKNHGSIHAVLTAALLFAAACGDNGGASTDTDATAGTAETTDTTAPTTDTTGPTTGTETTQDETTTTAPTTTSPTTTDGTTDTGDDGFVFPTEPFDAYTQIDRHGAVEAGTAGIAAALGLGLGGGDLSIRDDYNASNPVEDAAGMWLSEIAMSVQFFHDSFDDDLMALGLVPATIDETVAQAGPVIVPDTIKYDPSMPTGYPNGRALTDPVVDITLAAVLLKLGPDQPLTLFADLPLNPPENDVPFKAEFPFLAPPHPAP